MFELRCKDAGFDCPGVVHGATKDEVLQQAAAHAREVHHTEITPAMAVQVATLIREQPAPGEPRLG